MAESDLQSVENEYLQIISKKLRNLNKKLNISIANVEKKKSTGSKINEDELKLLMAKDGVTKQIKEYEDIRSQMQKIQNQGEKKPKGSSSNNLKLDSLVVLMQVAPWLQQKGNASQVVERLGISALEIDHLLNFYNLIITSGVSNGSLLLQNYLSNDNQQEEPIVGISNQQLKKLSKEIHSFIQQQNVVPNTQSPPPDVIQSPSIEVGTTAEVPKEQVTTQATEQEEQEVDDNTQEKQDAKRGNNSNRARGRGRGRGRGSFHNNGNNGNYRRTERGDKGATQ